MHLVLSGSLHPPKNKTTPVRGMGIDLVGENKGSRGLAQCVCYTNAKLAIKTEERAEWKSILFSLFLLSNEIVSSHDEIFTSFR